jgi:RNA polymerase sigma factor (sigma-70 family)
MAPKAIPPTKGAIVSLLPISPSVVEILLAQRGRFLSFLERRVGSREVAEDILQDAYARSLEKIDMLREDENVTAWFYRLLRNAIIDRHRRSTSANRALVALAGELEGPGGPATDLHDQVCRCVRGVLETLRPEYRDAITLVDLGQRDVGALAEQAGITSNNASVRLHRARAALGRELRATCGACAEHRCLDCTCRHAG